MKTAKDERKAIDNKKCFPNKRVEEMFWAYADEILDMDLKKDTKKVLRVQKPITLIKNFIKKF